MPLWKEISKPSSLQNQLSATQNKLPVHVEIANLSLIQSYKMAKYIFPKNDPGPSQAGLQDISLLSSLEYAVNVAMHRLTPELKNCVGQFVYTGLPTPRNLRCGNPKH